MELNRMIDHTILKADATEEDLQNHQKRQKPITYSVCINPTWVSLAAEKLQGRTNGCLYRDRVSFRANTSEVKAYETTDAIKNGADEVDMVINVGALKSKQYKSSSRHRSSR